jgi:hypothetical protein
MFFCNEGFAMKTIGALIAASSFLFQMSVAKADLLFNWSYTDGGTTNVGGGTLTATPDLLPSAPANAYFITSVDGVMNGLHVGNVFDTIFVSPSQLIYFGAGTTYVVDAQGISFSNFVSLLDTPNATAYNLAADGAFGPSGSPFSGFTCGGAPYCLVGPGPYNDSEPSNLVDTSPTADPNGPRIYSVIPLSEVTITFAGAVPESSTWAMMLLGFVGIGAMIYRRRGQTPALAA